MTLRTIARGLFLLPLIASAAAAQYSTPIGLATGTRVRVTAPAIFPHRTTATVLSAQSDTIVVRRSDGPVTLSVPLTDIQKLEISKGHSRAKWGALGAVIGIFAGGILGGRAGGSQDETGLGAAAGFFAGATLGLGAGIVTGIFAAPERWVDYPLPSAR